MFVFYLSTYITFDTLRDGNWASVFASHIDGFCKTRPPLFQISWMARTPSLLTKLLRRIGALKILIKLVISAFVSNKDQQDDILLETQVQVARGGYEQSSCSGSNLYDYHVCPFMSYQDRPGYHSTSHNLSSQSLSLGLVLREVLVVSSLKLDKCSCSPWISCSWCS